MRLSERPLGGPANVLYQREVSWSVVMKLAVFVVRGVAITLGESSGQRPHRAQRQNSHAMAAQPLLKVRLRKIRNQVILPV